MTDNTLPQDAWLAEAERLIDEHGAHRWSTGISECHYDKLGERRADAEAVEARAALLAHLRTRPAAPAVQPSGYEELLRAVIENAKLPAHEAWAAYGALAGLVTHATHGAPAAQPAVAVQGEPVAMVYTGIYGDASVQWITKPNELPPGTKLYTHPAPTAALTTQEIEHLWETHVGDPTPRRPLTRDDVIAFAYAIESALSGTY